MAEPLVTRDREDELYSAAVIAQQIIDHCEGANFTFADDIRTMAQNQMLHFHTAGVRGVSTPKARRKEK